MENMSDGQRESFTPRQRGYPSRGVIFLDPDNVQLPEDFFYSENKKQLPLRGVFI